MDPDVRSVDPDGREGGEKLVGVERAERIIMFMKKESIFHKGKK